MTGSIPASAHILLEFIRKTETGHTGSKAYETIFAHKQAMLPKPITQMTLLELQKGQANRWNGRVKSSASGAYQFMYKTLGGIIQELNLDINRKFDRALQDELGYHLLKRRKFSQWAAGSISDTTFAKQLAMEWASFPVLTATKGAHRTLKAGQSYYAGDGLNKALISTSQVRQKLAEARAAAGKPAIPDHPQEDDDKQPVVETSKNNPFGGLFKSFVSIITSIFGGRK